MNGSSGESLLSFSKRNEAAIRSTETDIKYDVTKDFTQSRTFEGFKKLGHVIYKVGQKELEFVKAVTDLFIISKPFIYEKKLSYTLDFLEGYSLK
ncbi:hypothetical protein RO3G_00077 [Rhizopus delemar RA 99-880]|uniref:Uncharacterized protein n=1 Tax=Rhizopus delemar (strain RA 99-880 / ATCC MYA-4621 / FGSC 9543 / NRRL 43880) TaxID=246409 RepID=I1BGP3_RHIO9|nr:hypothetical protein RO3G_00077 [Rhizopus delemar RA 99-880]|eukprot:EIE75373.1 hypothetical protein RO3G_00077 [Rhizopus delemar RA 99-880]